MRRSVLIRTSVFMAVAFSSCCLANTISHSRGDVDPTIADGNSFVEKDNPASGVKDVSKDADPEWLPDESINYDADEESLPEESMNGFIEGNQKSSR